MEATLGELTQHFLNTVSAHPTAAYGLVFLISFLESLAFFGIVMPGAFLMFGLGVVIANGALGFHPAALAATFGALCGDGLSYWLGRRFKDRLTALWPFSRHPGMLADGRSFFHRHGGKSILLGRFIGPIRPVAPLVAGMLGLAPVRFAAVDLPAALGWSYAYLLPGVVFGTSLTVSKAVSTRITVLALLLVLILWSCAWTLRRLAFILEGRERKGERLLFSCLIGVAVAATMSLAAVIHSIRLHGLPSAFDRGLHHLLQALATPWGDHLFGAVSRLGDDFSYTGLVLAVLLVLLGKRCYRSAGFWLAHGVIAAGSVRVLKLIVHSPRPLDLYQGPANYGFPSGHALMSAALLGFFGVLWARGKEDAWRWLFLGGAVLIALLMGLSRLYLGVHWPSDVLGGLAIGWLLTSLGGLAFLLTAPETIPRRRLAMAMVAGWLLTAMVHGIFAPSPDPAGPARHQQTQTMTADAWSDGGWQTLPGRRTDLGGERRQPILFQWAGSLTELERRFAARGWTPAPGPDARSLMMLLAPSGQAGPLPVLPRLHDGRPELLRMQRDQGEIRWVLRVWPTQVRLEGFAEPLTVGTVEAQSERRVGPWLTLPAPAPTDHRALPMLIDGFAGWAWQQRVVRAEALDQNAADSAQWNGELILAAEFPPPPKPR